MSIVITYLQRNNNLHLELNKGDWRCSQIFHLQRDPSGGGTDIQSITRLLLQFAAMCQEQLQESAGGLRPAGTGQGCDARPLRGRSRFD